VGLVAMAILFVTLWKLELTAKHAAEQLRAVRRRIEAAADDGDPVGAPVAEPGRPLAGAAS